MPSRPICPFVYCCCTLTAATSHTRSLPFFFIQPQHIIYTVCVSIFVCFSTPWLKLLRPHSHFDSRQSPSVIIIMRASNSSSSCCFYYTSPRDKEISIPERSDRSLLSFSSPFASSDGALLRCRRALYRYTFVCVYIYKARPAETSVDQEKLRLRWKAIAHHT